jgi:TorA maturation chaperone TorD
MSEAGPGNEGLQQAIRAAGGVTELARRIGISQPSISNWSRVPAERVLAVETATGVGRAVLWPDLYAEDNAALDETDNARAREYALLARLLSDAPDAALLARLARLGGDDTPLGLAHRSLADAAQLTDAQALAREHFELFVGVGRGEFVPYASFYLTGFLHERPLARLREDLAGLGIERSEERCEPEDHAGMLCEVMAGLIGGPFRVSTERQQQIFDRHLAPWIGRFFADLEANETSRFYARLGAVGRIFVDIEKQAFALPS